MKIDLSLPPSLQELWPDDREPNDAEKRIIALLAKAYDVNPTGVNHLVDGMDRRSPLNEDRVLLDGLTAAAKELDALGGGSAWVEAVNALKSRVGA